MKLHQNKFIMIALLAVLVAGLLGCGARQPAAPAPAPQQQEQPAEQPAQEKPEAATVPHALDGPYEKCMSCHEAAIKESHAAFGEYQEKCLDCHAQQ